MVNFHQNLEHDFSSFRSKNSSKKHEMGHYEIFYM